MIDAIVFQLGRRLNDRILLMADEPEYLSESIFPFLLVLEGRTESEGLSVAFASLLVIVGSLFESRVLLNQVDVWVAIKGVQETDYVELLAQFLSGHWGETIKGQLSNQIYSQSLIEPEHISRTLLDLSTGELGSGEHVLNGFVLKIGEASATKYLILYPIVDSHVPHTMGHLILADMRECSVLLQHICEIVVHLLLLCIGAVLHNFDLNNQQFVGAPLQGEQGPIRPELGPEPGRSHGRLLEANIFLLNLLHIYTLLSLQVG